MMRARKEVDTESVKKRDENMFKATRQRRIHLSWKWEKIGFASLLILLWTRPDSLHVDCWAKPANYLMSIIILDSKVCNSPPLPHNGFDPLFVSRVMALLSVYPLGTALFMYQLPLGWDWNKTVKLGAVNQNKELKDTTKARKAGGKLQSQGIIQCRYATFMVIKTFFQKPQNKI